MVALLALERKSMALVAEEALASMTREKSPPVTDSTWESWVAGSSL